MCCWEICNKRKTLWSAFLATMSSGRWPTLYWSSFQKIHCQVGSGQTINLQVGAENLSLTKTIKDLDWNKIITTKKHTVPATSFQSHLLRWCKLPRRQDVAEALGATLTPSLVDTEGHVLRTLLPAKRGHFIRFKWQTVLPNTWVLGKHYHRTSCQQ